MCWPLESVAADKFNGWSDEAAWLRSLGPYLEVLVAIWQSCAHSSRLLYLFGRSLKRCTCLYNTNKRHAPISSVGVLYLDEKLVVAH